MITGVISLFVPVTDIYFIYVFQKHLIELILQCIVIVSLYIFFLASLYYILFCVHYYRLISDCAISILNACLMCLMLNYSDPKMTAQVENLW